MIKLNDCNPKLRQRIQEQISKEDACKLRQSVAKLVSTKPEHHVSRPLDKDAPKRSQCAKGVTQVHVLLVRFGHRRLDGDNLAFAFKPLRDSIASELGCDDGDSRIEWNYGQVVTKGATGCQVLITLL